MLIAVKPDPLSAYPRKLLYLKVPKRMAKIGKQIKIEVGEQPIIETSSATEGPLMVRQTGSDIYSSLEGESIMNPTPPPEK